MIAYPGIASTSEKEHCAIMAHCSFKNRAHRGERSVRYPCRKPLTAAQNNSRLQLSEQLVQIAFMEVFCNDYDISERRTKGFEAF
jgi:hypothetical protein